VAEYDGIPVYLRYSTIEAELSSHLDEHRATKLARIEGWKRAIETVYGAGMVAYSADPTRSSFLDLLPLSKNMTALEIGIGFGQHTAAIASRVGRLDTLEVRLVNSLFSRIRCAQEGVSNVTFSCGGDDCYLPFSDASYDAVILNLVLEWCASGNSAEPGVAGQRRLLSEICRVLKPNGFLQLSTKNRFAYRLLIGGGDEHAYGTPFGSALPRFLLGLILHARGKKSAPGHLHSYGGLARLLRSVGLVPTESYWAAPEMRFPERYIPIDVSAIRAARQRLTRQSNTRATDLLMRATPAGLVKYFTPGFFFVVHKR
jgi:SAM-dependent methyltransferase